MKKVAILGAGLVSKPLADYLIDECQYQVIMATRTVSKAEKIINPYKRNQIAGERALGFILFDHNQRRRGCGRHCYESGGYRQGTVPTDRPDRSSNQHPRQPHLEGRHGEELSREPSHVARLETAADVEHYQSQRQLGDEVESADLLAADDPRD